MKLSIIFTSVLLIAVQSLAQAPSNPTCGDQVLEKVGKAIGDKASDNDAYTILMMNTLRQEFKSVNVECRMQAMNSLLNAFSHMLWLGDDSDDKDDTQLNPVLLKADLEKFMLTTDKTTMKEYGDIFSNLN